MKQFDPEDGIDISNKPIWRFFRRLTYFCIILVCLFYLGKWGITLLLKQAARDSLTKRLQWMKEGKSHQLEFYSTYYTDDTLQMLRGNPDVEYISFNLTDISDRGVEELQYLPNLKGVLLYGGQAITNQAITHLQKIPKLERLILRNTGVTHEGIELLEGIPQLKHLVLEQSNPHLREFTDQTLLKLEPLIQLKTLQLGGGWATSTAVEQLKRVLSKCCITSSGEIYDQAFVQ